MEETLTGDAFTIRNPLPDPPGGFSTPTTPAQGNLFASALTGARIIEDWSAVQYPDSIRPPNLDSSVVVLRYHRDFLLQFRAVCKERPDSLVPLVSLEALGLKPGEDGAGNPGNPRRGDRRRVGTIGMGGGLSSPQRQASMGLGLGPSLAQGGGFAMGNFQSPVCRLGDSQSRFEAATSARGSVPLSGPAGGRLMPMTRSAAQGGTGGGGPREAKRTRSQRGKNRDGSGLQTLSQQAANMNLEPVAPLKVSENRWVARRTQHAPQQIEERQLVERKVRALLNKLTMARFDSISNQIIEFANGSEQQKDGSTLMQVVKLVFEKAKDEEMFSEMYARLCRRMMERVSPNIQDEITRKPGGQPYTGGMLFHKYLFDLCQEGFDRGWNPEAGLATASKANSDEAAITADNANGKAVLYSDEYYTGVKAKRQGLGLVRFVGELFKLQMLTGRGIHERISKLLSNTADPKEEEIESLCKLLITIGQILDTPKARDRMDVYFEQMREVARGNNVNLRTHFMLLGVIELRTRHWQARSVMSQLAAHGSQDKRGDRHSAQPGGSRRGEYRNTTEPNGWNTAHRPPPTRGGDLSQFGKISKPVGLQFGPSSVFGKKDPRCEAGSSRANRANMFAALGEGAGGSPMTMPVGRRTTGRKASAEFGLDGLLAVGATASAHKKLNLLPRTKAAEEMGVEEGTTLAPAPISEAGAVVGD